MVCMEYWEKERINPMKKYLTALFIFLIYIQLPVTIRLVVLLAAIMLSIHIISAIIKAFDQKNEVKSKTEQLLQDQLLANEEGELLALFNRVVDRLREIKAEKDGLDLY